MSTQPTQPVMDFDALVDLLADRIEEYKAATAIRDGYAHMVSGAPHELHQDRVARAAWGIHWAAAEIGKVTP